MKENIEIRTFTDDAEIRIVGESRNIEGYGIVFNKESRDLGGFREIISPSAVEGVIEKSDILALMDHKMERGVLARSTNGQGSMRLTTDSKGVKYSFTAPNFDLGNELVEGVRRGDIRGSSFAFSVKPEGATYEQRRDGSVLRTITQFDGIFDMSPCYRGAYVDTTVALRSLDEFNEANSTVPKDIETDPVVANTTTEITVEVPEVVVRSSREISLERMNYNLKHKK